MRRAIKRGRDGASCVSGKGDVEPRDGEVRVKYLELSKGFDVEATLDAIRQELTECLFTLGPEVSEFEDKWAQLCQTRYAIGVNSGADALFLSLKALGIAEPDEVITPPNSFVATAGAIVAAGAVPVFVDVDDEYNLDPELIEAAVTPRTKAIMPVHWSGTPAEMPRIMEIAARHRLHVIEDAAQAICASIDGKSTGSFGVAAAFSMHPLKNLNVWGDGGVITTSSSELNEKLRLLRNHGLKSRDEVEIFGYNSRLDTIQAIVALNLMKDIGRITEARVNNAESYDRGLAHLGEYLKIPPRAPNVVAVYHTYVIQVQERGKLKAYLESNGIETKVHYPVPLHLQPAAAHLGYRRGSFPVCESQAETILTLPVHQHLSEEQIAYVVEKIHDFYEG